jgi:transcriptional regulator
MVVSSFTVPELNYLRDNCNFVGTESDVFELRSKGIPLEEIAELLNMSAEGIKKVSRKVNSKITRVL